MYTYLSEYLFSGWLTCFQAYTEKWNCWTILQSTGLHIPTLETSGLVVGEGRRARIRKGLRRETEVGKGMSRKWLEGKMDMPYAALSRFRLFATIWMVSLQAPLSMGFSRQEYWSELPCPSPGDLPSTRDPTRVLRLLRWQAGS